MSTGCRVDASAAIHTLEQLEKRIADKRTGQKAAELLQESTMNSFKEKKRPSDGVRWKPRKYDPKTRYGLSRGKRVRRRIKPHPLLVKTATLRRSVSTGYQVTGNGVRVWAELKPQRNKETGESTTKYGPAHQFGSKRRNIPRREFAGFSSKYRLRLRRWIRKHLQP